MQRADHPGKATRFKKGRRPHNKGRSFEVGGDSAKTRFKQGGKPHNWVKIGSERVTKYGYLQRKITDTGYPHRDWVPVHHLLWMDHHGSIPPGFIVVFRNRNKSDLALENLELISRAENMQRNTIHRYPAELKDTIRLASKLQRRLREKQD
ncbi:MAG: HNH endonuclease [Gammaproteobacteria bacterium]|nr:HNH endonuclease [Gammaproteobacteria bacterium]